MNFALDTDPNSSTFRDLLVTGQDLVLVSGNAEVLQDILNALATYLGEWFMDSAIGIDYFGEILVKDPTLAHVDALILDAMAGVAGVVQILGYSVAPDFITRQLFVTFSVQAVNGIIDYSGTVTP